jgi:hypothetical protein
MNGYTSSILSPHQLTVPGRGEAAALTDNCPGCGEPCRPASVLDEVDGRKLISRIGTYRCYRCHRPWLCWWAATRAEGEPQRWVRYPTGIT